MSLADRMFAQARELAASAMRQGLELVQPPIIPGVGKQGLAGMKLPVDEKATRIIESNAALYGLVSPRMGIIPESISTHPLRNITPQKISAIHAEVLTSGYMVNKACLDEDLILADSHIRAVDNSFRVSIVGSPFTVEPCDGSELARAVADYQMSVLSSVTGWQRACKRLLFGNLAGYAIEEAVYENRVITFRSGGKSYTVDSPAPVSFSWVRNANTRFNLGEGGRLELDTGGLYVNPADTPHKWMIYEAADDFQLRRRGYAYTAIWLAMIKLNAWARWGVLLDIWGLRAPFGKADRALFQDKTRLAQMIDMIQRWGRGEGAVFSDDFDVEASAGISDGDARGMHAALIGVINAEQSKLIQGEQLTTETGGAGSYALSETHADTKAEHVEAGEQNLSESIRPWSKAWLRLACQEYENGAWGEPRARGLSAQLGVTPEQVIEKCGRAQWRVTREMTPQTRMALYVSGVRDLGLRIDGDQPYREFGFAKASDGAECLKGPVVKLDDGDLAMSTTDAQNGVLNPKENNDA